MLFTSGVILIVLAYLVRWKLGHYDSQIEQRRRSHGIYEPNWADNIGNLLEGFGLGLVGASCLILFIRYLP